MINGPGVARVGFRKASASSGLPLPISLSERRASEIWPEARILEMTAAYASFFNGGRRINPTGIESVQAERRTIAITRTAPAPIIDPDPAAMMERDPGRPARAIQKRIEQRPIRHGVRAVLHRLRLAVGSA